MLRLVLCLLLFGLPAWAAPDHGLIENRTGLPLTLPLQVKTDPGRDIYLVMRNARTTEIAVTAFIEGGRFFRLLMPPGTYTLHAAIGREWQDEAELFGESTEFYTLPEPLTFRAGAARKHGHLVDLTARDRLAAAPYSFRSFPRTLSHRLAALKASVSAGSLRRIRTWSGRRSASDTDPSRMWLREVRFNESILRISENSRRLRRDPVMGSARIAAVVS